MMESKHPETELLPYLRGELAAPDERRVAGHVDGCPECRRATEEFRHLLNELRRCLPEPPPVHWGRYRAELRGRLEVGGGGKAAPSPARPWWWRSVEVALAAGFAGVLLLFGIQGGVRQAKVGDDLTAFEETLIGNHLDLLRQYALLEQLELLEDLDVIEQLDRLSATREG
jgi:anti-sigma factor RsiW